MDTKSHFGRDIGMDMPVVKQIVFALGVVISLLHLYFNIVTPLPGLLQNALHFSGFAIMGALAYPMLRTRDDRLNKWVFGFDVILGLAAAFAALYLIYSEDAIYERGVRLTTTEWICGIVLIASAIELTRRTTGWIIPILIILALSYVGWWGALIGGVFKFSGLSAETILFRSIYGDDGIFGSIARISSTFVFMFILFGAFLLRSGAGDFVVDLARSIAGRTVGGPGLVAIFSSALTGTISGSAVANTASTGIITIPLMKKAGFPPKFAAGVEAAASTGGQLMPPIMGAGAFVMASYTQIPYTTIIAVSVIPAVLYFLSLVFYVRIEAKRSGVAVVKDENVSTFEVIRKGGIAFLLPISVLISLLIAGFTPTYAAGVGIVSVIAASWLTNNKMGPTAIIEALALGARNMVMTGILLCSIGLVVNVIAMTGIGNTFSLMITQWAGDSLLLAVVLIALASLVLGMGLPVTASYIVLGTLSAPALYNLISDAQLIQAISAGQVSDEAKAIFMVALPEQASVIGSAMGTDAAKALLAAVPQELAGTLRESVLSKEAMMFALLSAHMIIFWLSQDSNVTPPVCLTAFTAAAIAHTPAMATGIQSWKMAKALYIIPILFAYTPLIGGSWLELAEITFFAILGLYAFAGAFQGYLERPLSIPLRLAAFVAAVALLWPGQLLAHIGGLIVFAAIFFVHIYLARPLAAHERA